jgi:hypothetical protein
MVLYWIFLVSTAFSAPLTDAPKCTEALEWSEALMDQYCTVEQTKLTYKHYESVGRAAVPCTGYGDYADDLLKSLANRLFAQCSAWCVYDFNSKGEGAWLWRNSEKCWNYTTTGHCHGIKETVTAKAAMLDYCYHCKSTALSYEALVQSNTTIFDATCYWRNMYIPCWYEVNTTDYDVVVIEVNLITVKTYMLRTLANGSLYWDYIGVSNLEHPGATHEMALTYLDNTPRMLLSQQLENAITAISFYDDGWTSSDGFGTAGNGWANFSVSRFTFGTEIPHATNLHKILFDKDDDNLMYLVFETSSTVCLMYVTTFYRRDLMTENELLTCYKIPYDEGYEYMTEYGVETYAAIHTCVQDKVGDLWCGVKYPNAMVARLHQPKNPNYEGKRWRVWNFWNGEGSEIYRPLFNVSQFTENATEPLSFITATHFAATKAFGTRRYIWFNSIKTGHVGWYDSLAADPEPKVCPLHFPYVDTERVHAEAENFMDEEWNSRPGGLLVTDEGNAIVCSYMPHSLILKVTRDCNVSAMSIDTGDAKYPLLYIPRELPIKESEPSPIFLGASTNDFPHVSYPGVYPEPDALYNSSVDAIIVVHDFVAETMTHGKIEVFMTPTQESWVHRVNVFSALDKEQGLSDEAVGHAVWATELLTDRLLVLSFNPN